MFGRDFLDDPVEAAGLNMPPRAPRVLEVAELLRRIKAVFSGRFGRIEVQGEIRSIKRYPSGHIYFDLKDRREDALISCVLFRGDAVRVQFLPRVGDVVCATGELNVFEPRGSLNFIVRTMRPAGEGDLYARFMELKAKLLTEGLFDAERKKSLPTYPERIGIVTSPEAAALRDVVRTLKSSAGGFDVILYPASVQGDAAEEELLQALAVAQQRQEVDVLLLVRGGGSLVDLWTFNSERLARAVAALTIPVIAGVGHETDVTIVDLVADYRAATPTAAAAKAVEHWAAAPQGVAHAVTRLSARMQNEIRLAQARLRAAQGLSALQHRFLERSAMRLDGVGDLSRPLRHFFESNERQLDLLHVRLQKGPQQVLAASVRRFDKVAGALRSASPDISGRATELDMVVALLPKLLLGEVAVQRERLKRLSAQLKNLETSRVLARGYALAMDAEGHVLNDASHVEKGQQVMVQLARGRLEANVQKIYSDKIVS